MKKWVPRFSHFPRASPIWWQPRQTVIFPPLVLPLNYMGPKQENPESKAEPQGPRQGRAVTRSCKRTMPEPGSPGHSPGTGGWWGIRHSRCLGGEKSLNRKALQVIVILFLSLDKAPSTKSPPRGNSYQFCSTKLTLIVLHKKIHPTAFLKSACKLPLVLTEGVSFSSTVSDMLLSLGLAPMFIKNLSQFLVRSCFLMSFVQWIKRGSRLM